MEPKFKRLKYACYAGSLSMSAVSTLSPILFLTFNALYGISYTLLGALVLANFVAQLGIDLIFTFFSHKFNISKTVKCMPILSIVGFLIYGSSPFLFPNHVYIGLLIGTIIFSTSSGLGEVLISPVLATIPFKEPEREMSKLHSVFAWGSVAVVIISTLFLLVFGGKYWPWLAFFFTLIPCICFILYHGAEIPPIETAERTGGAVGLLKNKSLWLCAVAIFLGGASECTMSQWASGYLEQALGIQKVWGDLFGVALFSVMLGVGRSLYGKYGKNITRVLLFSAIGATICYLTAAVSSLPFVGLIACALTGLCTAMLWPGTLVTATDRIPAGGVFVYAMMAAGGDLGASVGPQLIGIITDTVIANPALAKTFNMAPEQMGMKSGMLLGMLFPLLSIPIFAYLYKTSKKIQKE